MAGAGNVAAVERRGVVVLHGQLVVGAGIVVDRADLFDRISQLKELLEDLDDLRGQFLVHDGGAAVRQSVEADVVDVDPPQVLRAEWTAWPPAWAEIRSGDRLNAGRCWRRGRR